MDNLTKVAEDHEVIYVPCHRSHIDYLLLSFLVYRNGLVPPHIAAGINLNLPVVGTILRRGGAFFMRRSFRDNPLYASVFSEYLHTITARGFSIEYFVEGGRSRSGRMLKPRTGMLAMTLRSFLRDSRKPIAFVPVYIGYEKVIESGSYIGELHGEKKQKESVGGLMKSLSVLRSYFGQVHVNFGEPIKLVDFLDQHHGNWRQESPVSTDTPPGSSTWLMSWDNRSWSPSMRQLWPTRSTCSVSPCLPPPSTQWTLPSYQQQLNLYIALLNQAPYSRCAAIAALMPRKSSITGWKMTSSPYPAQAR